MALRGSLTVDPHRDFDASIAESATNGVTVCDGMMYRDSNALRNITSFCNSLQGTKVRR